MLLPEINSTSKSSPVPPQLQSSRAEPTPPYPALARTLCTIPSTACGVHSCQTSPSGNPSSFSSTSSPPPPLLLSLLPLYLPRSTNSKLSSKMASHRAANVNHVISKSLPLQPAAQSCSSPSGGGRGGGTGWRTNKVLDEREGERKREGGRGGDSRVKTFKGSKEGRWERNKEEDKVM